jgi:hypothetical protein
MDFCLQHIQFPSRFGKTKIFVSLRDECGGGNNKTGIEWLHSNIILTNLVLETSLFSNEDSPKMSTNF